MRAEVELHDPRARMKLREGKMQRKEKTTKENVSLP